MQTIRYSILFLSGLFLAFAAPASRPAQTGVSFHAESRLVLVPVTVVDRWGASVTGLRRDAFTITENGVAQNICSFSEDDAPVSLGVVLDTSGSMAMILDSARYAVKMILDQADPLDQGFLNTVSTQPGIIPGLTHDVTSLLERASYRNARGSTALTDTICGSVRQLRSGVHPRRALVVVSDGMDNHSRNSKAELMAELTEADAQVYTIAVEGSTAGRKAIDLNEAARGLAFLDELAARSGGIPFRVRTQSEIQAAARVISYALHNRYNIGYVPRNDEHNGQWRKIRVKVGRPGAHVYARAGYRPA